MKKPKHIHIFQDDKSSLVSDLFPVLERLTSVKFSIGKQSKTEIDGAIFTNSKGVNNRDIAVPSIIFALPKAELSNKSHQVESNVEFADDKDVPLPFKGRKIRSKLSQPCASMLVNPGERVLASNEQGPVWLISEIDGLKRYRSALPLPDLAKEQNFNDVFNGDFFIEMLVLLQFIREICAESVYQSPPLRATFIIDDPNLHWPSYGFFGYSEIVDLAYKENFHVSFATIPLDTWYTHAATAKIFQNHSQRISLLIHGNNHAKEELALNYSENERKALLRQAIARIVRLEKNAKVQVSRVMVPPHGACSNEMLKSLPSCGFESACISSGSLRFHNPEKSWVKTLGFFPSELIEGCPVLPRWGLTGNVENTLLIAAFLGQPLILRGHHQDLKNGGGEFIKFARYINSLGDVFWGNMTDLSRLNYQWRLDKKIVWIRPMGQKTLFKWPKGATGIIIENPCEIEAQSWQLISADGVNHDIKPGEEFTFVKEMDDEIIIHRNSSQDQFVSEHINSTPPKLILRRLLTELRDRLLLSD